MRKRVRAEPEEDAGVEDAGRYSRRRRKPAQAWWIASSEKEKLLDAGAPGGVRNRGGANEVESEGRLAKSHKQLVFEDDAKERHDASEAAGAIADVVEEPDCPVEVKTSAPSKRARREITSLLNVESESASSENGDNTTESEEEEEEEEDFVLQPQTPSPTSCSVGKADVAATQEIDKVDEEKEGAPIEEAGEAAPQEEADPAEVVGDGGDGVPQVDEDAKRPKAGAMDDQEDVSTSQANQEQENATRTGSEEYEDDREGGDQVISRRRDGGESAAAADESTERMNRQKQEMEEERKRSLAFCGKTIECAKSVEDGAEGDQSSAVQRITLLEYDAAKRKWTVDVSTDTATATEGHVGESEKQGGANLRVLGWFDVLALVTRSSSFPGAVALAPASPAAAGADPGDDLILSALSSDHQALVQPGTLGSPNKVAKAHNFVSEMCSLWKSNSEGAKNEDVGADILTPGSHEGGHRADLISPEALGPFSSPIQDHAQTSSEQRLLDLLATPRSTEVTPESKPSADSEAAKNQDTEPGLASNSHAAGKLQSIVIPRQILGSPQRPSRATTRSCASTERAGLRGSRSSGSDAGASSAFATKGGTARKKLKLGCDKEFLENELCNLLLNKKIIKHWREGNEWASKDVNGKALDAYRIAELEERLLSTAREARAVMTTNEITMISRKAHSKWIQLKEKYSRENKSPRTPIKGILKQPQNLVTKPTPSSVKKVTFLTELIEFGSPMKVMN